MNVPKMEARPELTRVLHLRESVAVVVGIVVGMGVFRIPTDVAGQLNAVWPILAIWVIGGAMAFLGSLVYAELASAWPRTGGPYVSLRECLGPLPSFLYGWGQLLVVRPAWLAAIAIIFAEYVSYFLPVTQATTRVIAICAILAASIINYVGIQITSAMQNTLTAVKILALLLIVVVAFAFTGVSGLRDGPFHPAAWNGSYLSALGAALMLVYWTYDGWSEVTVIAGEIHEPRKTILRALVISCLGVTVLYVLVNLAYLHILTLAGVTRSERVASDAMVQVMGSSGGVVAALLVVIATFGALHSTTLAGSRLFFAMAVDGNFFSWAGRVDQRYRTPSTAIVLQALLAIPLVMMWTVPEMVTCYMFVSFIFHGFAAAALFYLRRMKDAPTDRYRTWGYPFTPLVFLAVALLLPLNAFFTSFPQAMVGSVVLASGVPTFFVWRKLRPGRKAGGNS